MIRNTKIALTILSTLLMVFIICLITFSQGIGMLHNQNNNVSINTLETQAVHKVNSSVSSLLFLDYDIVESDSSYYVVLDKSEAQLKAVKIKDIFNEVLLFSNVPFLLLILLVFVIPYYVNSRADKKANESLRSINLQVKKLLQTFKIDLPQIEQQNSISSLSQAVNELNKYAETFQKETEISIYQDKLTGLLDRHAYLIYLKSQLHDAEELNKTKALLFIDLDGFKQVNDSFGHSFGDEVLIQVAQRLATVIRNNDLSKLSHLTKLEQNLSRLGGDEFSIFIDNMSDPNLPVEVAKNVIHEIERDFVLGNKIIKIGASIGIAVYPDSASNPNTLLQMADVAMYRAKTDGRGIFRVYSPEMGSKMRRYHYLLEEMRIALSTNSFTLSFQPIVSVEDCSIDYFESLVRWHHPIEGPLSPAEFIPIAEESNLILELGNWILFEACRQMSAWHNAGMNRVRISVNISGVQLKHLPIYDWVMETLAKTGLPPTALLLEITESCFIDAAENVITDLEKLRHEGILIAIDDFGTGFSSLSTLANLPIDVIKIDKLFIDQANINPKYHKILNSISELGKNLDLKIVAEGVELAQQFELVKRLGIHCIQGYLIGRPETSYNVGTKVIKRNLNHIALTGTGVMSPTSSAEH